MKKLLSFITVVAVSVCAFFLTNCSEKKPPLVVVTTGENAPFVMRDQDKNLVGFEVDLVKMLAKSLRREVEFKCVSFEEVFSAIRTKSGDIGIASISITPERSTFVDFSPSYHSSGFVLLVPDTTVISGLEDLKDKIVGVRSGTWQENIAKSSWERNIRNLFVKSFDKMSEDDIVINLRSSELAAVVLDADEASYLVKKYGNLKRIPLDVLPLDIGMITGKDSSLSKDVAKFITENKEKIAGLEVKWFSAKDAKDSE